MGKIDWFKVFVDKGSVENIDAVTNKVRATADEWIAEQNDKIQVISGSGKVEAKSDEEIWFSIVVQYRVLDTDPGYFFAG